MDNREIEKLHSVLSDGNRVFLRSRSEIKAVYVNSKCARLDGLNGLIPLEKMDSQDLIIGTPFSEFEI